MIDSPAIVPAPPPPAALVLDDDESMRDLLRAVLESLGHRVLEAGSVEEARRLLRARPWDLLLCDVNLGDGSGIDAARAARVLCPDIAIVMVTCRDDPETENAASSLGVQGYVVKPFSVAQVTSAVRRALSTQQPDPVANVESKDGSPRNRR